MSATAEYSISALIHKADYVAAYQLHSRSRLLKTLSATVGLSLIAVALSFTGVLNVSLLVILFTATGGVLGAWLPHSMLLPRKAGKLYEQFKGLADPFTVAWGEDHIEFQSPAGNSTTQWRDYVNAKEDGEIFLLYLTDALFQVIPKRCFDSTEKLNDFLRHAHSRRKA